MTIVAAVSSIPVSPSFMCLAACVKIWQSGSSSAGLISIRAVNGTSRNVTVPGEGLIPLSQLKIY